MIAKPKLLPWWGPRMDLLAGLVVFVLIQLLLEVSLRAAGLSSAGQGAAGVPSAVQGIGYLALATATFGVLVLGFAVATSQRRTPAIISYPIIGVIALGTVLFFALPFLHFPAAPDYPVNPGYCSRTDSENCPGG